MRCIDKCNATDWVVFSDGSVREGIAAAGVSFGNGTISVRLSDGASILQESKLLSQSGPDQDDTRLCSRTQIPHCKPYELTEIIDI